MTSHRRGWCPGHAGSDRLFVGPAFGRLEDEDTDDDIRRSAAAAAAAADSCCCFVPQAQNDIDTVAEEGADAASGPAAVVVDRYC